MTPTVFRISVIDGALCICEHRLRYGDLPVDRVVRQLRSGPSDVAGYDYEAAVKLGSDVGWDAFCLEGSREHRFRETIRELLQRIRPVWARACHRGRLRMISSLSVDQIQCFEVAGLLSSPATDDVVAWWNGIGRFFRRLNDDMNAEVGRAGELATLEHETRRLKADGIARQPIWVSVDDEGRGFDILSYRRKTDGRIHEVQIEVKASRYTPVRIFLSRSQWNRAALHPETHLFHIWNLDAGELRELTVQDMSLNIPTDHGRGEWQRLRVTISGHPGHHG